MTSFLSKRNSTAINFLKPKVPLRKFIIELAFTLSTEQALPCPLCCSYDLTLWLNSSEVWRSLLIHEGEQLLSIDQSTKNRKLAYFFLKNNSWDTPKLFQGPTNLILIRHITWIWFLLVQCEAYGTVFWIGLVCSLSFV